MRFINAKETPTGRDVELICELARQMQVNIDLRMIDWNYAMSGIQNGSYDLLPGVNFAASRQSIMQFFLPISSEPYIVFGAPDRYITLTTIAGQRLAALAGDSLVSEFISSATTKTIAVLSITLLSSSKAFIP